MKTAGTLLSLAAVTALASAGCYRTRFDLAPPQPEVPSSTYNDHFHFSLIGVIELSRPVDLQGACMGQPPTAVEEQIGVLGGLVNAVLFAVFGFLHVHNATLYCPMGGVAPNYGPMQPQPYPPPGGQPMPPQPMPPQPMPQQ